MQSRFILNLVAIFLLLLGLVIALVGWVQVEQQAQTADAQDVRPTAPEDQISPSSSADLMSYAVVQQ